jgi:hypothetical protein
MYFKDHVEALLDMLGHAQVAYHLEWDGDPTHGKRIYCTGVGESQHELVFFFKPIGLLEEFYLGRRQGGMLTIVQGGTNVR